MHYIYIKYSSRSTSYEFFFHMQFTSCELFFYKDNSYFVEKKNALDNLYNLDRCILKWYVLYSIKSKITPRTFYPNQLYKELITIFVLL